MEDVAFDKPVELMTIDPTTKKPVIIKTAGDAIQQLLDNWPTKPGPRHRKARQALVDLFEGTATPQEAREAFEQAADEAQIRIGGWHAKNPLAAFISKQPGFVGAKVPRKRK